MSLLQLLSGLWSSLGWSITWQMAMLALLALACQRFLRVRHPGVTHALWWFVLLAPLVLAPVRFALARQEAAVVLPMPAPAARAMTDAQVARFLTPPTPAPAEPTATAPSALSPPPARPEIPAPPPSFWERLGLPGLVALLWLIGCAAILFRLLLGHRWVRAMLRGSLPVRDEALVTMLRELCEGAGVAVPVALHRSAAIGAPVLYGWQRPMIVLPEGWLGVRPEEGDSIAAAAPPVLGQHELPRAGLTPPPPSSSLERGNKRGPALTPGRGPSGLPGGPSRAEGMGSSAMPEGHTRPNRAAGALSVEDLHALLAHEVAHITRRDFAINVIQRMLAIPLFFHPAVWLANRHISLAREQICDTWALDRGADPASYAHSLATAAARAQARFALVSVGVAEGRSTLFKRVEAIMGANGARRLSRKLLLAMAALLLLSAAAFAAVQLTTEGLTPELRQALADLRSPDLMTRMRAAGAIEIEEERAAPAIPALIEMLADDTALPGNPRYALLSPEDAAELSETTVAVQAQHVLARLREAALPGLARGLSDSNPRIRRGVLLTMAGMVEPARGDISPEALRQAVGDGIEKALHDADPSVAQAAAYALGMLRDAKAMAPLLAMARDPDPKVRLLAVGALGPPADAKAKEALFAALGDSDQRVAKRAAFGLAYYGDDETARRLVAELRAPDAHRRALVAGALYSANGEGLAPLALEPLLALTHDPDPAVRAAAVSGLQGLDRMGQRVGLEVILPLMRDPDPRVRREASMLLVNRDDPQAAVGLVAAARDADPAVRSAAIQLLSGHRDWPPAEQRAMLEVLQSAARDPEPLIRQMALFQLGSTGNLEAVPALLDAMHDQDPSARASAIQALGMIRDPRAKEPLRRMLREGDIEGRVAAARALGQLRSKEAVPDLVTALQGEDGELREAAAQALGQIDDAAAAGSFIEALDDPSWRVRASAALALEQLGDKRAVPPLISALQHDPDRSVRAAAAKALGRLGDPRALDPLTVALKDQRPEVRYAAAESLRTLDGSGAVGMLSRLLADEDPGVRAVAAQALSQPGAAGAVEPLLAALKDRNPRVRAAAAEALGLIGDPRGVAPLLGMLHDPDEYVRGRVQYALGDGLRSARNKAVAEPFLAALRSKDPLVRNHVLQNLLWLKDRRATEPVIDILLHGKDPQERGLAISVLGESRDPRAVEPLITTVKRGEFEGAWYGVYALGQIGGPRAQAFLLGLLHGRDVGLRRAAAQALGEMKAKAAVPDILVLARDPDAETRGAAASALAQIADPRAVPVLVPLLKGEDANTRRTALIGLGEIGDPHTAEAIAPLLEDPQREVRMQAAIALGKVGDRRSLEQLVGYLTNPDYTLTIGRDGAAEAMARLKDPAAVPILIQALTQDTASPLSTTPGEPTPATIAAEVKALRALTGQDFGTDAAKWQEWWAQRKGER